MIAKKKNGKNYEKGTKILQMTRQFAYILWFSELRSLRGWKEKFSITLMELEQSKFYGLSLKCGSLLSIINFSK